MNGDLTAFEHDELNRLMLINYPNPTADVSFDYDALGLACGYLMTKSDSIWGAVIIHAASDFFLFLALLANA